MDYRTFLAAVLALVLAACTSRTSTDVEYVATRMPSGEPYVLQGMPGSVRARFRVDTAQRRVTIRLRVFRGDSLTASDVATLGEGAAHKCAMLGEASWTCGENAGQWTFDNNELRFMRDGELNAMIFLPQPVEPQ